MALNVKSIFPLNHPEVTYPEKAPAPAAASGDNQMSLEKENLKEKAMEHDVENTDELHEKILKRLNHL